MAPEVQTIAARLRVRYRRSVSKQGGLLPPFLRAISARRRRRAALASELADVRAELERVRERHEERIDRLEDLVQELVRTSESLRRSIAGESRVD